MTLFVIVLIQIWIFIMEPSYPNELKAKRWNARVTLIDEEEIEKKIPLYVNKIFETN